MRRALLLLTASLPACASAGPCAPGRTCGAATWRDVALSESFRSLPPSAMDGDGGEVALSASGVRMRFDLRDLGPSPRIVRAVLSVRVDAGGERDGVATLRARSLLGAWESGARDDTPRGQASAEASVPAGLRAPLRLDVTELLAESAQRGVSTADLALSSDDRLRVFGPWRSASAPRLEVAVR